MSSECQFYLFLLEILELCPHIQEQGVHGLSGAVGAAVNDWEQKERLRGLCAEDGLDLVRA